jgi:hypothetical protein
MLVPRAPERCDVFEIAGGSWMCAKMRSEPVQGLGTARVRIDVGVMKSGVVGERWTCSLVHAGAVWRSNVGPKGSCVVRRASDEAQERQAGTTSPHPFMKTAVSIGDCMAL